LVNFVHYTHDREYGRLHNMRGKILLSILESLYDQALSQVDFFEAVLASGYGASMGKIDYEHNKRQSAREHEIFRKLKLKERKRRLEKFIYKMKRDGLIEKVGKNGNKFKISKEGKLKLKHLKDALPERYYELENKVNLAIISFDIPEKFRRKRDWLREVIRNLGFEMVHKSVWIGKRKIPKKMVLDLERLGILEFVEIFEISKTGTIEKIKKNI